VIPPRRRLWVYVPDTDPDAVEIVMLGSLDEIGHPFALVKGCAERWRGFERVEIVGGGPMCGILRMRLTAFARYVDPLAEVLAMFEHMGVTVAWAMGVEWASPAMERIGLVGTW